jgi:hypothetical protein
MGIYEKVDPTVFVANWPLGNDGRIVATQSLYVRDGSWLCENAKTLNRDRRSYSSKTVLVAQRASGFNLEVQLKNIILRRVSIFEFLHSQGHQLT